MSNHCHPASLVLVTVCLLLSHPGARAQQADVETSGQALTDATATHMDSGLRLRQRIRQLQQQIFDYYNAHNSTDRFDILCRWRSTTGSHIRRRVCEPRFLVDLRSARTQQFRLGRGTHADPLELMALSATDYAALQADMQRLIQANASFARQLADLAILHRQYHGHPTQSDSAP